MNEENLGKRTNGVATDAPVEVARSTRRFRRQLDPVGKVRIPPVAAIPTHGGVTAVDRGDNSVTVINVAPIPGATHAGGVLQLGALRNALASQMAQQFSVPINQISSNRNSERASHNPNTLTVGDANALAAVRNHVGNEFGRRVPVNNIIAMSLEPGVWFYIVQWKAGDIYHALAVGITATYTETLSHRSSHVESSALGSVVLHRAAML